MIEGLTARQVIEMIANEYYELSHDKIKLQRDDHVRWCKQWLRLNPDIEKQWRWRMDEYETKND